MVGLLFLFWWDIFAQSISELWTFTDSGWIDVEWIKTADAALKTLYLIMRPLLALAWATLDNTLVYGEAFYLTEVLYKFWQLMRTFTMFGVGFVFVGTILYAYFNPATAQEKIKDVVIKSLIASVVINISWWIVAALIDISTILVVAVGALPLQIMGDTDVIKDIRFVKTHTYYDKVNTLQIDANEETYTKVHSCPWSFEKVFFIDCMLDNVEVSWTTLSGMIPKNFWTPNMNDRILSTYNARWWDKNKIWMTLSNINIDYCFFDWGLVKHLDWAKPSLCEEREGLKKEWRDAMKPASDGGQFNCHSYSELTRLAANTSWPLYTLYGSIFAVSNLPATTNYGNIGEVAVEMTMKIVVWMGLVIPLLTFAVVMIIRVVVLRLVIAFSPILAMAYVYDFKKITEISDGKFTFQNILNLLMMPVLGVFALSISIVFLSILNNVDYIQQTVEDQPSQEWWKCYDDMITAFLPNSAERPPVPEWIEKPDNTKCYDFLWLQTVCINEWERVALWNVANTLSRLVTNLLWVALMWMAVMAVLKTNKFTAWTVDFIDSTAKSIAKSTKIIPVPWLDGWAVSVGGAEEALSQLRRSIPQNIANKAYNNSELKAFTDKTIADSSGVDNAVVADAKSKAESWDTSFIASWPEWRDADKFSFKNRESRWLPETMWRAIANDITKNRAQYPNIDDQSLKAFGNKKFTSFEQLMSEPVFVNHATNPENNYFDTFVNKWWGSNNVDKARSATAFKKALVANGGKAYSSGTTNGMQTTYYLHNWRLTKVRSDAKTGIIDPTTGGVKSYAFPTPTANGGFKNKESIDEFVTIFKDEFNSNPATYRALFGDDPVPYSSFVDQLANISEDQQEISIATEENAVPITVTTETARDDQWNEVRTLSRIFVWTEPSTWTNPQDPSDE